MTNTKHTKGTWKLIKAYEGLTGDEHQIAVVHNGKTGDKDFVIYADEGSEDEQYGNALLMVCARELLEAVKNARSFYVSERCNDEQISVEEAESDPYVKKLDSVIAKAEGKSQQ